MIVYLLAKQCCKYFVKQMEYSNQLRDPITVYEYFGELYATEIWYVSGECL